MELEAIRKRVKLNKSGLLRRTILEEADEDGDPDETQSAEFHGSRMRLDETGESSELALEIAA